MSVAVDANVLLHASNSASVHHERALQVVRDLGTGPQLAYLFWPVAMAYLRIATHPALLEEPLTRADATANLESLLGRASVRSPGEDEGFWSVFRSTGEDADVRGNLVPDAHLVALMHQYGVSTIITHDRDFRRFDGISVRDPFG